MTNTNNRVFVITGPSGAGKTTLGDNVASFGAQYGIQKMPTSVTRVMRSGEQHGEHYYFHTIDAFQKKLQHRRFFEWEEVFPGDFYAMEKRHLKNIFQAGKIPVIVSDVKGALKLKNPEHHKSIDKDFISNFAFEFIYVTAPEQELHRRILKDMKEGKRNHTQQQLYERFERIQYELSCEPEFSDSEISVVIQNTGDILGVWHKLLNQIVYPRSFKN